MVTLWVLCSWCSISYFRFSNADLVVPLSAVGILWAVSDPFWMKFWSQQSDSNVPEANFFWNVHSLQSSVKKKKPYLMVSAAVIVGLYLCAYTSQSSLLLIYCDLKNYGIRSLNFKCIFWFCFCFLISVLTPYVAMVNTPLLKPLLLCYTC